jgi:hypothetical protein
MLIHNKCYGGIRWPFGYLKKKWQRNIKNLREISRRLISSGSQVFARDLPCGTGSPILSHTYKIIIVQEISMWWFKIDRCREQTLKYNCKNFTPTNFPSSRHLLAGSLSGHPDAKYHYVLFRLSGHVFG